MPKRSFKSSQRGSHRSESNRTGHNRVGSGRTGASGSRAKRPTILLFGIALIGLLWFAPAIIVKSPLKDRIIASATSDFQGTISVESISAGWLSKLRANNIVATDEQGERLVEATAIELDKNLVSLLSDQSNLGTIRIEQPIVNLVVREDGSNFEDAIAKYLLPSDNSSSIGCMLEVGEGILQVTDTTTGATWNATKLNAAIRLPSDASEAFTAKIDSQVNPFDGTPGTIVADLVWQQTSKPIGSGNLNVKATAIPLELAGVALQRVLPGTTAEGVLHGNVAVEWGDTNMSAKINSLSATNIAVVAPEWLGPDRFTLQQLSASGEVVQRGGAVQIQALTVNSDIGQVTANGAATVTMSDQRPVSATLAEALRYGQFQVDGKVDLARLAQMLPTTLKIREGTHVATGEVTIALGSNTSVDGHRWDGRIEARNLSAMHEGRHLTWEQPIVLTGAARDQTGIVVFDQLACESSFLNVVASGTSQQGTAKLNGDLSRFAAELSQFVDLGEVRLAGQLDGNVGWQMNGEQRIQLEGSAGARQFELIASGRPPWREQMLNVQFAGVGNLSDGTSRTIEQCELTIRSGQDQLDLNLLPAPAGTVQTADLPVSLQIVGELRNWMTRLQPVFTLPGWNVDGTLDMNLRANVGDQQVRIDSAVAEVGQLRISNASVFINEPVLKIDTKGTFDRVASSLALPDTTVVGTTIALRGTQINVLAAEPATQISGTIDYRGDVARITNIFNDPQQPASRRVVGEATGRATLRHAGQVTSCEWTSDISDFEYAVPAARNTSTVVQASHSNRAQWTSVWQEPKLKLGATFTYDSTSNLIDLSHLQAAGDTVSFAARGSISDLTTRCLTQLDGQVAYDLQKLSGRFRQQLGNQFQIAGRDTRPFSFNGPLFAQQAPPTPDGLHPVSTGNASAANASLESAFVQMIAQASLGWTSASMQGVAIGPGEIDARLSNGKLMIAPMDLRVSEGNLHLAPTVLLDRSPMVVTLPAGPIAERIRISPQMCTSWLKYLAPLVADATAAEGNFSVTLTHATVPVDTPSSGQVEGVLEIHNAQIGPGPLSQQLILLATQIKAIADGNLLGATAAPSQRWLDLPAQRIGFRMADNRVYHEGLQMTVKDVVIRTSGSVGTDQTISIIAEVPVRDEWLAKSQYLAPLRGETIRVPIHGTLTSPKLDQSALSKITQQTVTGAANRYLQGGANQLQGELDKQLNRGLQKLFGAPQ